MKTYSYSDKVQYFTNKAKNAVSTKQAWYFHKRVRSLAKFYELTDKQLDEHKAYLDKFAKVIEEKYGKTTIQKPTASASVSAPAPKLPKVVEPSVSKNGRTNNALRVKAVIANLEASIEILRAIK